MSDKLELSVGDAVEAFTALQALVQEHKTVLDAATSFRLARVLRQLRPEVETHNLTRDQLIARLGQEDEEGRLTVKRGTPEMIELAKETRSLLDQVIHLPIQPIDLDDLGLEHIDADIIIGLYPILVRE